MVMAGSVSRRVGIPIPTYARCPFLKKFGSVRTVNPPTRINVVAVPMKVTRPSPPSVKAMPAEGRLMGARAST